MIDSKRFGLAGGILWGVSFFLLTIVGTYLDYADQFFRLMEGLYPGYSVTWVGALVGGVYGFLDAFIGLYLLAWPYNKLDF